MFRAGVIEILTRIETCSHHVHVNISANHCSWKVISMKFVHVGLEEEVTELMLGSQKYRDRHGILLLTD